MKGYPMKTTETSETMSSLQRFLPPSPKTERIHTENSTEFIEELVETYNGIMTQALLIAQK